MSIGPSRLPSLLGSLAFGAESAPTSVPGSDAGAAFRKILAHRGMATDAETNDSPDDAKRAASAHETKDALAIALQSVPLAPEHVPPRPMGAADLESAKLAPAPVRVATGGQGAPADATANVAPSMVLRANDPRPEGAETAPARGNEDASERADAVTPQADASTSNRQSAPQSAVVAPNGTSIGSNETIDAPALNASMLDAVATNVPPGRAIAIDLPGANAIAGSVPSPMNAPGAPGRPASSDPLAAEASRDAARAPMTKRAATPVGGPPRFAEADPKSIDTKSIDTKSIDTKSGDTKSTDAKRADATSADINANDTTKTDTKSLDASAIDAKSPSNKSLKGKPLDSDSADADAPTAARTIAKGAAELQTEPRALVPADHAGSAGAKPLTHVNAPSAQTTPDAAPSDARGELHAAVVSAMNHITMRREASGHIDVPDFGRIDVSARRNGAEIDVRITAALPETARAIHQKTGEIAADLRAGEIPLHQVTVGADGGSKGFDRPHTSNHGGDDAFGEAKRDDDAAPIAREGRRVRIVL